MQPFLFKPPTNISLFANLFFIIVHANTQYHYFCCMNISELVQQIKNKQTYLCVGLDTDATQLPLHLKQNPNALVEFNKAIIDATKAHCVSYKINTAFYESAGAKGWQAMEETLHYVPSSHFTIADAKRGDIGNTAAHYAKTFFETLPFDAVTVNPYMGEDSVRPFLEYQHKVTILLGLTSNKGANDFEMQTLSTKTNSKQYLYELVLEKAASWGTPDNTMFVVGATQSQRFSSVRKIVPNHFFLVPGIGAQGGSLEEVSHNAMTGNCGLLVNASRAIIYAGNGEDFAEKAGEAAKDYHQQMQQLLEQKTNK